MRIRRAVTLLSFVATGLLASFSLAVGGAPPASAQSTAGNGSITFIQGTWDLGPVDVWVNGILTVPDLNYTNVSAPVSLPPGSYSIRIRTAGSPQSAPPILNDATVNLSTGQNVSFIFYEDSSGVHVQTGFVNPTTTTPAGDATLIVRNTALTPAAPALDVYAGSTQIASALTSPNQASVNLPAGSVSVSFVAHPSTGPSPALISTNLSLTAGHVYVLFAVGSSESATLTTALQSYTVGETYTATGYVLAGSDGAAYTFGGASYEGSLPGLGVSVNDIVGAVPTG